jgi:hypothetical protein
MFQFEESEDINSSNDKQKQCAPYMDDLVLPSKDNNLICPTKKLSYSYDESSSTSYSSGDRSYNCNINDNNLIDDTVV